MPPNLIFFLSGGQSPPRGAWKKLRGFLLYYWKKRQEGLTPDAAWRSDLCGSLTRPRHYGLSQGGTPLQVGGHCAVLIGFGTTYGGFSSSIRNQHKPWCKLVSYRGTVLVWIFIILSTDTDAFAQSTSESRKKFTPSTFLF